MEVYPAAALGAWLLPAVGYKGPRHGGVLATLADSLCAALGDVEVSRGDLELLRRNDHAFDAFVCALVARAARLGHTERPPPEARTRAAREGWIAIPTCQLSDLLG